MVGAADVWDQARWQRSARRWRIASGPDAADSERPEYLVVEMAGADDPVEVLSTTLRDHGWLVNADGAVFGGSASPGDGGYHLTWQPASAVTDFPLADHADRTDARQLLLTIHNPPGLPG